MKAVGTIYKVIFIYFFSVNLNKVFQNRYLKFYLFINIHKRK
jgi:hypothetical protein